MFALFAGKCMLHLGILAIDTRDAKGRTRFFPDTVTNHTVEGFLPRMSWLYNISYYPFKVVGVLLMFIIIYKSYNFARVVELNTNDFVFLMTVFIIFIHEMCSR